MKHKLFSVVLLLGMMLVACGPVVRSTETGTGPASTGTAPVSTEPTPASTDAAELNPPQTPQTESILEPGGVEVALALVAIPDQETIALVNGDEISTADYQEEILRALYSVTDQYGVDWNDPTNRSLLPSFQEQVLDQIIGRTLMNQLASQEGITASSEEIEAEIASIRAQIEVDPNFADWDSFLAANNFTEQVFREIIADNLQAQALAENHSGSSLVEQVHASHILVETEETGQEVLDRLAAGEEFAALAVEYSTDPGSKDQGGDLGWFAPGMMVPQFEQSAFSLEPGETSGLVQTDFGYHIIQVSEKEEREMEPELFAQLQQQQFQGWFETQLAEANIERLHTFEASE